MKGSKHFGILRYGVPGVTFTQAWQNRLTVAYHDQEFFILAKEDLIASKKASGREVDLEDVRLLELKQSEDR